MTIFTSIAPLILWAALLFFACYFVFRLIKRNEKRAEERLRMERDNARSIQDLHERISSIETLLKQID
ncbi:hypothetical protein LRR81_13390 [Metabacillus sp. GX 13764]|uniref:hypothetical protein n=1 Tax=Metabacillus kandeliae TaxID=2900151 RepID=UPI001E4F2F0D|nr:hypothetical protein [Metabacillus kandeliae]MCD7035235.1 hypothetical protein [Metabacillus kandeliae]